MAMEAERRGITERIDIERGRGCIYAKPELADQVRALRPIYADGFGMAYIVRDDRRVPIQEVLPNDDPAGPLGPRLLILAHQWLEWIEVDGQQIQVVIGEDPPINLHNYRWSKDAAGRIFTATDDGRRYLDDIIEWLEHRQKEFEAADDAGA